MRIPHAGSGVLGLRHWGARSEDGPGKSGGSNVMAGSEVTPRYQDVPGLGQLLQKIHQGFQPTGGAAHEAIDKGEDGEEIPVGRGSGESIRPPEGGIHNGTGPSSLWSDPPYSLGGRCLRLRAGLGGFPENTRWP